MREKAFQVWSTAYQNGSTPSIRRRLEPTPRDSDSLRLGQGPESCQLNRGPTQLCYWWFIEDTLRDTSRHRLSMSNTVCSSTELCRETPFSVQGDSWGSSEDTGACTHRKTILIPRHCSMMACKRSLPKTGPSWPSSFHSNSGKAQFSKYIMCTIFLSYKSQNKRYSFRIPKQLYTKTSRHFTWEGCALHHSWPQGSWHLHKGRLCT